MEHFITYFHPACSGGLVPLSRVRGVFRMNKPSPADTVLGLLANAFDRIAATLDRMAPPATEKPDFAAADAFVWHADGKRLEPVTHVNRVEMRLLKGIDRMRDTLVENTERFAKGLPANNALLWGARGMGKSSLVKAVHAEINARAKSDLPLKLIEIHREDIDTLPKLMG